MAGLENPLVPLKNPGITSIPPGFPAVILGSLPGRHDPRAEEMWEELYVRQNARIGASGAPPH